MSRRPTLAARLKRALRRRWLQVRIRQLAQLLARPDLWMGAPGVTGALIESRLAELRCELYALDERP